MHKYWILLAAVAILIACKPNHKKERVDKSVVWEDNLTTASVIIKVKDSALVSPPKPDSTNFSCCAGAPTRFSRKMGK